MYCQLCACYSIVTRCIIESYLLCSLLDSACSLTNENMNGLIRTITGYAVNVSTVSGQKGSNGLKQRKKNYAIMLEFADVIRAGILDGFRSITHTGSCM